MIPETPVTSRNWPSGVFSSDPTEYWQVAEVPFVTVAVQGYPVLRVNSMSPVDVTDSLKLIVTGIVKPEPVLYSSGSWVVVTEVMVGFWRSSVCPSTLAPVSKLILLTLVVLASFATTLKIIEASSFFELSPRYCSPLGFQLKVISPVEAVAPSVPFSAKALHPPSEHPPIV